MWTGCKDVDSTACATVCENSTMLSSRCAAGESDAKEGKEDWGKKEDATGNWDQVKDESATGTSSFEHTWKEATKTRTYTMVKPSIDKGLPVGMVVVLQPGGGGCGKLSSLAQSSSLVVVCPFTLGSSWKSQLPGDSEDVDFIAKLTTRLTTSLNVPVGKVIVTGFSAGGSMAFRVLCERSDVVGGIVPMGQAFFEPAGGHVQKGTESEKTTITQQALQLGRTAREGANKCDPTTQRPHYALVGTQDAYYGEASGTYKGKLLWEFYSTNVQGCTGQIAASTAAEAQAITGKTGSTCYHYPSCPGLSKASLNQYCVVEGFGHDTVGWEVLVAVAFADFFAASTAPSSTTSSTGSAPSATSALSLALTTVFFLVH